MSFDLETLHRLDTDKTRDKAVDHLMNYWDDEFLAGRFDEFKSFSDSLDLTKLNPSVICCVHTIALWVADKYDLKPFGERVRAEYARRGFPAERIQNLCRGFP